MPFPSGLDRVGATELWARRVLVGSSALYLLHTAIALASAQAQAADAVAGPPPGLRVPIRLELHGAA